MTGKKPAKHESRGIKSVEVGYQVLLAIQRGPGSVQLAEIGRRTGLSSGAAHNYVASLIRTGLVEQEGRGVYRLGPSAFALSLASFRLLNGYDVLRDAARTLFEQTGESVAVAVWSQGGPVSIFIQQADETGALEFRTGLVPMLRSAAGPLAAAYLSNDLTRDVLEEELGPDGETADAYIERNRALVLPKGYACFRHEQPEHYALAAPIWSADDRMAFILSLVVHRRTGTEVHREFVSALLGAAAQASMLLGGTGASGPRSSYRNHLAF